jgi:serine/threonine protein kinase
MAESHSEKERSKKVDPYVGMLFDNSYQIISLLGQGATTSVYKSRDVKQDRLVAVKILHFQFGSNEGTVQRFKQEIQTIRRLNHVNIVSYFDSGITESGEHYLVTELADGSSLKQLIKAATLDCKRTLRLFSQICAALIAAHQNGVVHRDLKPANIILTRDAQGADLIKLLDFGVAKLLIQGETFQTRTQTGEMLGTLLYMSPEQCLDQDLDGRSDIYSLGCVLYECLTGTPPFSARTAFETMNLHLTGMPNKLGQVRPDLTFPKHLDSVLQKALAIDQKHRYQSVAAFAEDLEKIEKNAPGQALISLSDNHHVVSSVSIPKEKFNSKLWQCVCGLLFLSGFPLCFVAVHFGVIVCMAGFLSFLIFVALDEQANSKQSHVEKKLQSEGSASLQMNVKAPLEFDVEKFAESVFNIVDSNKDGLITQFEMQEILKENHSLLTLHGKTFIQFVLDHYHEFKEIFNHPQNQEGLTKQEILNFARSLPESMSN